MTITASQTVRSNPNLPETGNLEKEIQTMTIDTHAPCHRFVRPNFRSSLPKRWSSMLPIQLLGTILAIVAVGILTGSAHAATIIDGWTVVDDTDGSPEFTQISGWRQSVSGDTSGFDETYWFDWEENGSNPAYSTWTFTGLTNGRYEVAVTWVADTNRTTAAPFTIQGSTFYVNQENAPDDFTLNDGDSNHPFEILTSTAFVTDGTLTVRLDDVANPLPTRVNFVIADAVAIRAIPEPASGLLLVLGGLVLFRRRRG